MLGAGTVRTMDMERNHGPMSQLAHPALTGLTRRLSCWRIA